MISSMSARTIVLCLGVTLLLCTATSVRAQDPPGGCELPLGHPLYCKLDQCGPCGIGVGDCDGIGITQCQSGLICSQDVGADYGFADFIDVCEVPATTVLVNCDDGGSINDALNTPAVELIIEISGTCIENVLVQRDAVTLRGETDNNGDPITVIMPAHIQDIPPNFASTLLIRNSTQILVQNLIITGGRAGLVAFRAGFPEGLFINNCIIEGNNVDLIVSTASVVDVEDSIVGSVEIEESSSLLMLRVELTGTAIDADFPFGILVLGGSRVDLQGVTQDPGIPNTVGSDSALFASCADCSEDRINSTLGHISVETLSRALIRFNTTLEDLTCSGGADAFCDGTETKTSSTCDSCP